MKHYKYGVLIGRFSPIHNGHVALIKHSLQYVNELIIVVGSSYRARSTYIPFTYDERVSMITMAIPTELRNRIKFTYVEDSPYNDPKWLADVQHAVMQEVADKTPNSFIGLCGMKKDNSSYYLNQFPQWGEVPYVVDPDNVLSATNARRHFFVGAFDFVHEMCPTPVANWLEKWTKLPTYAQLVADYNYEIGYADKWGPGPHVTVDSCVIQAGHILLVERGGDYGRGTLALPGGFLNRDETIIQGIIRELREETRLKVPDKVLLGCMETPVVFDHPFRSNRGRIITHAAKIVLNNVGELPKVVGSDDAKRATWYPISQLPDLSEQMFEDHGFIIQKLLGL